MLRIVIENLSSLNRACANCGRLWGRTDLLCDPCWRRFDQLLGSELERMEYDFKVYALFCWEKEEIDSLKSRLLLAFKGGGLGSASQRIANLFAARKSIDKPAEGLVFVPAPPRIHQTRDHAYAWGQALARCYGGTVLPLLRRGQSGEQKSRALAERAKSTMSYFGQTLPENPRLIFVDDLIASGYTAKAAFEALGKPEHFEVWTVAHRPRVHHRK